MTSRSILSRFLALSGRFGAKKRPDLATFSQHPNLLPGFVRESPVAMRYLELLGLLDWAQFPERDLQRDWGRQAIPYAAFVIACLVQLDQGIVYMSRLRRYLIEHPALIWLAGFSLTPARRHPYGFDPEQSLPAQRHLARMLRTIPNATLQFLLDSSVACLLSELAGVSEVELPVGQCISLDTKHLIAWVKENNPKAYVSDRYNKEKQPNGDPDCRLGCKRKHNQRTRKEEPPATPPTPTENAQPARGVATGEWYWGYGSGVVAVKVPGWCEFVLAELTQPFNQSDVSYFFPLMEQTERRLGFRPRYGAFDAAYDAFYVYAYFHAPDHDGFAAIPWAVKGKLTKKRTFDEKGLPLCEAGLAMPCKLTFTDRTTTLVVHERARYACPLQYPERTAETCPAGHAKWKKGGCVTTMATSIGARLRALLDRESEAYKNAYKQRTATERVNSQAVDLGIERPKFRNGQAIANRNTLIYVLINLRALRRVRAKKLGD